MKEAIEKAKRLLEKQYDGKKAAPRKWIEAHCDSYADKSYRVQIFVREGSPCKGSVLANYGQNIVIAYDAWMQKVKKWKVGE